MKPLFFLVVFLVFSLNESCTSPKAIAGKPGHEANPGSPDSLFFSIQRTPCYGTCPVYKVTIYRSGYAIFEATRNVTGKEGKYEATFTKEEMKMISDKAGEINYFSLDNEYDSPVTDLPSVITELAVDGKKKSIKNRHHGPPELRQFEKFCDGLINGKEWNRISD